MSRKVQDAINVRVVLECAPQELDRMRRYIKRVMKTAPENALNGTVIVTMYDDAGNDLGRNEIVPAGFEPPSKEARELAADEDHPHVA